MRGSKERKLSYRASLSVGVAIVENDRIERHIMKVIPGGHNLFVPDNDVSKKIENIYNRFKVALVKRDEASVNRVTSLLKAIDEELQKKNSRCVRFIGTVTQKGKICNSSISNAGF